MSNESNSIATADQLRRWWWLHEGRWYQEVGREYGYPAANRINRTNLRYMGFQVARKVAATLGAPIAELEWPQVVAAFCQSARLMWPAGYVEFSATVETRGIFVTTITRNFAIDYIAKAGTLTSYECPCLDIRRGWFAGLGIQEFTDEKLQCMIAGDPTCTMRTTVPQFQD